MKNILIILILLFFNYDVFSQQIKSDTTLSEIYIFENLKDLCNYRVYFPDDSPNYLQISGNQGAIVSRTRDRKTFLEGKIKDLKISTENGKQVIRFYISGRNRSLGKTASFEIFEITDSTYKIHYYNNLSCWDWYYSAHSATNKEKNQIIEYWKKH